MPDLQNAAELLESFYGGSVLKRRIAQLESSVVGKCDEDVRPFLNDAGVRGDALDSAFLFKSVAGQINVVIHAMSVLLSLPHILKEHETVQYVSLGAGNTGRGFDLETDRRVAEFKLIQWKGGPESIRQNQLFKDLFNLAKYEGNKQRCLYVLDTKHPLKFLNGNRALKSVLSKNDSTKQEFYGKYGDKYEVVSQYYNDVKHLVEVVDLRTIVPELADV